MTWPQNLRPIRKFGPFFLVFLAVVGPARAQPGDSPDLLAPRPVSEDYARYAGKPIRGLEVVPRGRWFHETLTLRWVRLGDPFNAAHLRSAVRDLLDGGHLARADIEVWPHGDGVFVRILVELRRLLARLSVAGAAISDEELFDAAGIKEGDEITDSAVDARIEAVRRIHVEHGYPDAKVTLSIQSTEDPLGIVLVFNVDKGRVASIAKRRFEVAPDPNAPGIGALLTAYDGQVGEQYDESSLLEADRELAETLKQRGWYEAKVSHRAEPMGAGMLVRVRVEAGPKYGIIFVGNRTFDTDRLFEVLEIETNDDRNIDSFVERLRKHYISYGFLDVSVAAQSNDDERLHRVTFTIDEGSIVRVAAREFPCLTGERGAADVGAEIDSFLAEALPGAELLGPVDPQILDATIGPEATTGARPVPLNPNPYATYAPRVYERAMKHLQDLYRSDGYLAATVGPVQMLRRRCAVGSPPGQCRPLGPLTRPSVRCAYDEIGLPLEEPAPQADYGCVQDSKRVRSCASEVALQIPIKLGPRTVLWDVAFDGNQRVTERELGIAAEMPLGKPLSLHEVEQGRRRLLDGYAERGFAYAEVTTVVEPSPDHTRARVRFSVREGEQVTVGSIIVKGAKYTSERLIRGRIALEKGQPYRRSDVRATEERLGTLGVFSTIRVGLEDPYVPAKEKNVVIEVVERVPQYFEPSLGFSSGEGVRGGFSYGHLNVGGKAVQLMLRARAGYLPNWLIMEPDVRAKYESDVGEVFQRLERMVSLQVAFPDIGLGPLFRLGLEGLDVHDNSRDFGLTKDAFISTLTYQPNRRVTAQLAASLERNDVSIFGDTQDTALLDYLRANPQRAMVFRVPQGTTGAVAERITVSWDRRDVPLDARSGTFATTSVEHVTAQPLGASGGDVASGNSFCTGNRDNTNPFAPTASAFLRWASRLAGYIPLSRRGTSLAVSFRWGLNYQLRDCSRTYPDRLFFVGGVDTIRGFLQGSLIPEDMAQQVLASIQSRSNWSDVRPNSARIEANDVVMRGGNFFINPRVELRLPLDKLIETVVFLDAGNVWSRSPTDPKDPTFVPNYLRLRYAVGTGLRINTPVGPLAFDYGLNVERVLDRLYPSRKNQRYWEDLGAFSFSIGLF
jgi:outer membrane protein insertion porin family